MEVTELNDLPKVTLEEIIKYYEMYQSDVAPLKERATLNRDEVEDVFNHRAIYVINNNILDNIVRVSIIPNNTKELEVSELVFTIDLVDNEVYDSFDIYLVNDEYPFEDVGIETIKYLLETLDKV